MEIEEAVRPTWMEVDLEALAHNVWASAIPMGSRP